jgi:zinc finger SWIM domain-containing protein 3
MLTLEMLSFLTPLFNTNKYEMYFALISGTNHHIQTISFGAALLFNESLDSFAWLFKAFMETMSSKKPETIFTNEYAAMAKAIIRVPSSSHRLYLWHINVKIQVIF